MPMLFVKQVKSSREAETVFAEVGCAPFAFSSKHAQKEPATTVQV